MAPIFDMTKYISQIEPKYSPYNIDTILLSSMIYRHARNASSYDILRTQDTNINLQLDGGANINITSDKTLLNVYQDIAPHPIGSAYNNSVLIYIDVGIYYLQTNNTFIYVRVLYSTATSDNILSSTAIVTTNKILDLDTW